VRQEADRIHSQSIVVSLLLLEMLRMSQPAIIVRFPKRGSRLGRSFIADQRVRFRTRCHCLGLVGLLFCLAEAQQTPQAQPRPDLPQQYLNTKPNVQYVGDEACRGCHGSIYAEFKKTGMGMSVSIPSAEEAREFEKPLKLTNNNQTYSIYARDGKIVHEESVRDAKGDTVFSEAHDIAYSVGAGDAGKSYLIAKGDSLFVSPISYYTRIRGWDLSPGYADETFHGFTRRVVDLCVDCHTGMPQLVPGSHTRFQQSPFRFLTVACERCHGPGEIHVAERTQDAFSGAYRDQSTDFSIVNPRKLPAEIRDDVCAQCHFSGDARVLQPGKNYLDFRPGTSLGDIVAIFSVPPAIKGNHFLALGQFEQLKTSGCWIRSNGRLGCVSCHDPHVQPRGDEAAGFFRERCLACHATHSCSEPIAQRQTTSPPDNCTFCHMPKQPSENIGHSSITDHRVLRRSSEIPDALQSNSSSNSLDLIYDTKPPTSDQKGVDLRNRALAYSQLAEHFPELSIKGFAVLEQAAAEIPADAEVQAAYGLVLSVARPKEPERVAQALQRAIDLGSKSAEVRTHLARLRMQQDQVTAAIQLYNEAIRLDPYDTAAYVDVARIYSLLKEDDKAVELLNSVLQIDPGDNAARQALSEIRASSEKK
jgi:Tetratricopeptide repeat